MRTSRHEVYAAVDSERAYQDHLWSDETGSAQAMEIGSFILLLDEYVARARKEFSQERKPEVEALKVVRKIAGIAVNCMEQHGAPRREGF